jgi:predicted RNA-binding Zn ribbon-like protein
MLENERFRTATDVAEWAVAARLRQNATTPSEQTLAAAHELRHGLHELLLGVARHEFPTDDEIAWLNAWLRDCHDHLLFAPSSGDAAWKWAADTTGAGFDPGLAMLGLVVLSAVDLLQSSDRSLLRVCANDRCGWLFVDRSRKHNRRWCEMRECGGRSKARRYQSRRRPASTEMSGE